MPSPTALCAWKRTASLNLMPPDLSDRRDELTWNFKAAKLRLVVMFLAGGSDTICTHAPILSDWGGGETLENGGLAPSACAVRATYDMIRPPCDVLCSTLPYSTKCKENSFEIFQQRKHGLKQIRLRTGIEMLLGCADTSRLCSIRSCVDPTAQ